MRRGRRPASWPASRAREFGGVSIDTRTIARGELFVAIRGERFDGADVRDGRAGQGRGRRRRAARLAAARRTRRAGRGTVVIEVADTTAALQALGARGAARVGDEGRGHHRQRRQDHDEGSDGGVSGDAVSRRAEPREPQQPHRAAAVADRAAAAAGGGGGRAGHEPRGRNQHAGADRRAGRPRLDERRRRAPRILRVRRRHRRREGRDSRRRRTRRRCSSPTRTTTAIAARLPSVRRARRRRSGSIAPRPSGPPSVVDRGIEGMAARVATPAGDADSTMPLVGRGNLLNVLAATAVAVEFGVPLDVIAAAGRTPAAGVASRRRRPAVEGRRRVVDDSYNANPTATRGALDVLARVDGRGTPDRRARRDARARRSVDALHEDVGRTAAARGVDAAGHRRRRRRPRRSARAAVAAGMPRRGGQALRDERRGRGGAGRDDRGPAIWCS